MPKRREVCRMRLLKRGHSCPHTASWFFRRFLNRTDAGRHARAPLRAALTHRASQIYSRRNFAMTDSNQIDQPGPVVKTRRTLSWLRVVLIALGFVLLYIFYVNDLSNNPPGFYIDESAIAYNAY